MASPQKERGYTPIANEIMEAVAKLGINGTQFRILTVVWRYTYGFSRKEHRLSERFISNATGIHKKQVGRELAQLIRRKILLEVVPPSFSSPRVIAFNKDYESWQSTKTLTVNKSVDSAGIGLVDSAGIGLVDQDKQVLKQNLKQGDIVFSLDSNPFKAALYLKSKIAENHPRQPLPPDDPNSSKAQSWAQTMDLLNRLGPPGGSRGYGWPEIRRLIDFATSDPFWQNNILSAQKFRAQIVKLEAKAKQEAGKEAGRGCHSPEHKRLGGASR